MGCVMLSFSFVLTLFTKAYSLSRGRPAAHADVSGETTVCSDGDDGEVDPEKAELGVGAEHIELKTDGARYTGDIEAGEPVLLLRDGQEIEGKRTTQ